MWGFFHASTLVGFDPKHTHTHTLACAQHVEVLYCESIYLFIYFLEKIQMMLKKQEARRGLWSPCETSFPILTQHCVCVIVCVCVHSPLVQSAVHLYTQSCEHYVLAALFLFGTRRPTTFVNTCSATLPLTACSVFLPNCFFCARCVIFRVCAFATYVLISTWTKSERTSPQRRLSACHIFHTSLTSTVSQKINCTHSSFQWSTIVLYICSTSHTFPFVLHCTDLQWLILPEEQGLVRMTNVI